jgi:CRP-like cAMP-binding protein
VIVGGTAEVRLGTEVLRRLGPGDFFGELAALNWGAGFGYVRTASVVATSRLRLLVLTPAELELLMAEAPEVDKAIRDAAAERLKRT